MSKCRPLSSTSLLHDLPCKIFFRNKDFVFAFSFYISDKAIDHLGSEKPDRHALANAWDDDGLQVADHDLDVLLFLGLLRPQLVQRPCRLVSDHLSPDLGDFDFRMLTGKVLIVFLIAFHSSCCCKSVNDNNLSHKNIFHKILLPCVSRGAAWINESKTRQRRKGERGAKWARLWSSGRRKGPCKARRSLAFPLILASSQNFPCCLCCGGALRLSFFVFRLMSFCQTHQHNNGFKLNIFCLSFFGNHKNHLTYTFKKANHKVPKNAHLMEMLLIVPLISWTVFVKDRDPEYCSSPLSPRVFSVFIA